MFRFFLPIDTYLLSVIEYGAHHSADVVAFAQVMNIS
jgi:hypothetical protein